MYGKRLQGLVMNHTAQSHALLQGYNIRLVLQLKFAVQMFS